MSSPMSFSSAAARRPARSPSPTRAESSRPRPRRRPVSSVAAETAAAAAVFVAVAERVRRAVAAVAATDPHPSDPFRGLYVSDEAALAPGERDRRRRRRRADRVGRRAARPERARPSGARPLRGAGAGPPVRPAARATFTMTSREGSRARGSPPGCWRTTTAESDAVLARFAADAPLRRVGARAPARRRSDDPGRRATREGRRPSRGSSAGRRARRFTRRRPARPRLRDRPRPGRRRRAAAPGAAATPGSASCCSRSAPMLPSCSPPRGAARCLSCAHVRPRLPRPPPRQCLRAALAGAALCFELDDLSRDDYAGVAAGIAELGPGTLLCARRSDAVSGIPDLRALAISVPEPSLAERRALWRAHAPGADVDGVAERFRLSMAQIAHAADVAGASARSRGDGPTAAADLERGAREASRTRSGRAGRAGRAARRLERPGAARGAARAAAVGGGLPPPPRSRALGVGLRTRAWRAGRA